MQIMQAMQAMQAIQAIQAMQVMQVKQVMQVSLWVGFRVIFDILENVSKLIHFLQYLWKCVKFDILYVVTIIYILKNISKLVKFVQTDPLFAIFLKMCPNWYTFCDILEYVY